MVAAFPQKIFPNERIFNLLFLAYVSKGRGTTIDEHGFRIQVRTARTTNGRVMKAELLSWLPCLFGHLGSGNWKASACHVFESPVMNTIDMLLP